VGHEISDTMQKNIQSVQDSFGGQANVELVALNATDAFNLQKIEEDEADRLNRQKLTQEQLAPNRQQLEQNMALNNRQVLSVEGAVPHFEQLDPEVRLQNIYEVVGAVNERLDHFESENFSFLEIGRVERYDDSFVPIDTSKTSVNRQRVNHAVERKAFQLFSPSPLQTGVAVTTSGLNETVQHVAEKLVLPATHFNSTEAAKKKTHAHAAAQLPRIHTREFKLRWTRLNYVQLITAFLTLMFAAPISTKTMTGREAAGTLILLSQDLAAEVRTLN
jgi:hypothetical protein